MAVVTENPHNVVAQRTLTSKFSLHQILKTKKWESDQENAIHKSFPEDTNRRMECKLFTQT